MFTNHLTLRRAGKISLPVILFSLTVFLAESVNASQSNQNNPLGEVSFKTSCLEAVAMPFNSAQAKLHHMMYVQAEEEFSAISKRDPNCAMAYWGIAMTRFHQL